MMVDMMLFRSIYFDFIGIYEVVKMDEGKLNDDIVEIFLKIKESEVVV